MTPPNFCSSQLITAPSASAAPRLATSSRPSIESTPPLGWTAQRGRASFCCVFIEKALDYFVASWRAKLIQSLPDFRSDWEDPDNSIYLVFAELTAMCEQ